MAGSRPWLRRRARPVSSSNGARTAFPRADPQVGWTAVIIAGLDEEKVDG